MPIFDHARDTDNGHATYLHVTTPSTATFGVYLDSHSQSFVVERSRCKEKWQTSLTAESCTTDTGNNERGVLCWRSGARDDRV